MESLVGNARHHFAVVAQMFRATHFHSRLWAAHTKQYNKLQLVLSTLTDQSSKLVTLSSCLLL